MADGVAFCEEWKEFVQTRERAFYRDYIPFFVSSSSFCSSISLFTFRDRVSGFPVDTEYTPHPPG
jgi:hypothetical protein